MTTLAWHFTARPDVLRDGQPQRAGEWEIYRGSLALCKSGLHASLRALDALGYAPGPYVRLVEVGGTILYEVDKLVCSRRRPLWIADATEVLRLFARLCALDVIHLWDAPAGVRDYLETGDEALRAAAWSAARAARAAAWAAWAAWSAAWAAAWAARDAARAAAWAARDAAWSVSGAAAARAAQNETLESLLMELLH